METPEEALRRAVHETLDRIVSPAVRDTLLAEALTAAALSSLPSEVSQYLDFLDGPLRRVLEQALGRELGRSVADELERLSSLLEGRDPESERALEAARARAARSPAALEGRVTPERTPTRSDIPSPDSRRTTLPAGGTPEARAALSSKPTPSNSKPTPPSSKPTPPSGKPTSDKPAPTSNKPAPSGKPTIATEIPYSSRAPTIPAQPAVLWSEPRPPASGDFPSGTAHALGMQSDIPGFPRDPGAAPSSRQLPVVFIATRDPELVRRFSTWLDPQAVVVRVSRLIDLLLDLEDVGKRRTVIVFDYRRPPWRAEALSALAEELPDETRVLLWGATRESQADLGRISARVTRWMACPETMPLADIVERCVQLVG
jgi:hypothetical protein